MISGALLVPVTCLMVLLYLRENMLLVVLIQACMELVVFPWTLPFLQPMLDTCAVVAKGTNLTFPLLSAWLCRLNRLPVSMMTEWFLGALLVSEESRVVLVSLVGLMLLIGTNLVVRWPFRATALAPLSTRTLMLLVVLTVWLDTVSMPVLPKWSTLVTLTVDRRVLTAAGVRYMSSVMSAAMVAGPVTLPRLIEK